MNLCHSWLVVLFIEISHGRGDLPQREGQRITGAHDFASNAEQLSNKITNLRIQKLIRGFEGV